jgi:hypothetical protein
LEEEWLEGTNEKGEELQYNGKQHWVEEGEHDADSGRAKTNDIISHKDIAVT